MNTKQELLTRMRQIISEHLGVEEEEITENSTWTGLGADSLDRLDMSLAIESSLNVDIPHLVGERLNTVGQTVDHLLTLIDAPSVTSNIRIETVTTWEQWVAMSKIRTQVFTEEHGFSFTPLPEPGQRGVWHFLAADREYPIGTLSVIDTTDDRQLQERCRLSFHVNDRVARYAQLAIVKPYRNRGILKMLIENAQSRVIRPDGFALEWLLVPAVHARSSTLIQELGFKTEGPVVNTEFGRCHVLTHRGTSLPQASGTMMERRPAAAGYR
jgi:acyl carrier protein